MSVPEILSESLNELSQLRKKPVLVLKLKDVDKGVALEVYETLKGRFFDNLDVILDTFGGDPDAGYQIANLLIKHSKNLNIIIPMFAKSAGTLIALASDRVLMTDMSELGPLDTQVAEFRDGVNMQTTSALDSLKALEHIRQHNLETLDLASKMLLSRSSLKLAEIISLANQFCGQTSMSLYSKLEPIVIAGHARALEVAKLYAYKILLKKKRYDNKEALEIVRQLVDNYPSHGFVIDAEELEMLKIPVELLSGETLRLVDKIRLPLLELNNSLVKLINPEDSSLKNECQKEVETKVIKKHQNN